MMFRKPTQMPGSSEPHKEASNTFCNENNLSHQSGRTARQSRGYGLSGLDEPQIFGGDWLQLGGAAPLSAYGVRVPLTRPNLRALGDELVQRMPVQHLEHADLFARTQGPVAAYRFLTRLKRSAVDTLAALGARYSIRKIPEPMRLGGFRRCVLLR
jgi:hypothetical protein